MWTKAWGVFSFFMFGDSYLIQMKFKGSFQLFPNRFAICWVVNFLAQSEISWNADFYYFSLQFSLLICGHTFQLISKGNSPQFTHYKSIRKVCNLFWVSSFITVGCFRYVKNDISIDLEQGESSFSGENSNKRKFGLFLKFLSLNDPYFSGIFLNHFTLTRSIKT